MKFGKQLIAVGLSALVAGGALFAFPAQTSAQSDQYERSLAGVRLNSKASIVLKYFGNPNDVVIGDVGVRESPNSGGSTGSSSGAPGGGFGGPSSASPPGTATSLGGRPNGRGGGMATNSGGGGSAAFGGSDPRNGDEGGGGGFGAPGGGFGTPGGYPGGGQPGGGGGTGQFGSTLSNLTPQQETTWIYNRRAGKDVVSYEFLIGNGGVVTQIRVIGYAGGGAKTRKSVVLGSTYKEVVQKYGVPEQQFRVGRSLIASYKGDHHVLFQFLNQRSQTENPLSAGNKVIAITIASIE